MKHLPICAALAAAVAFALPAAAQCPASMAYSDPGAEPVSLALKYAWKIADSRPVALKNALEKLTTVVRTGWDEQNPNRILVKFRGRCEQIVALEAAARDAGVPAYVVNHAHVSVVLKIKPGADVKGAIEAMGKVSGALFAKASGTAGLEVHADLALLSIDEIRGAVAPFKCEAIVDQTYEYVRFRVVEGSDRKFQAAAGALKGVVVTRSEGNDVVGMWLNKSGAKAEHVGKIEGFKLERR